MVAIDALVIHDYKAQFQQYLSLRYRDSWGRICCEVVAIDALVIHDYKAQFQQYLSLRYRDSWGRICCEVVAIDALVIHDYKAQFQQYLVKRELNKVHVYHNMNYVNEKTCLLGF